MVTNVIYPHCPECISCKDEYVEMQEGIVFTMLAELIINAYNEENDRFTCFVDDPVSGELIVKEIDALMLAYLLRQFDEPHKFVNKRYFLDINQ